MSPGSKGSAVTLKFSSRAVLLPKWPSLRSWITFWIITEGLFKDSACAQRAWVINVCLLLLPCMVTLLLRSLFGRCLPSPCLSHVWLSVHLSSSDRARRSGLSACYAGSQDLLNDEPNTFSSLNIHAQKTPMTLVLCSSGFMMPSKRRPSLKFWGELRGASSADDRGLHSRISKSTVGTEKTARVSSEKAACAPEFSQQVEISQCAWLCCDIEVQFQSCAATHVTKLTHFRLSPKDYLRTPDAFMGY